MKCLGLNKRSTKIQTDSILFVCLNLTTREEVYNVVGCWLMPIAIGRLIEAKKEPSEVLYFLYRRLLLISLIVMISLDRMYVSSSAKLHVNIVSLQYYGSTYKQGIMYKYKYWGR